MAEDVRAIGLTAAQIVPGLLIGVIVAVASAFVSHLLSRSRERERWDHEDRIQRERREHEWQLRHRDDRLELYRRFLLDLWRIHPKPNIPDFDAWEKAEHAWRETDLLGSKDVRESAQTLLLAKINQAHLRGRVMSGELSAEEPKTKKELDKRDNHLRETKSFRQ